MIAVVVDSQLDRAAQVPIGGKIRFRWAESTITENTTPEPAAPEQEASN